MFEDGVMVDGLVTEINGLMADMILFEANSAAKRPVAPSSMPLVSCLVQDRDLGQHVDRHIPEFDQLFHHFNITKA